VLNAALFARDRGQVLPKRMSHRGEHLDLVFGIEILPLDRTQ